nr:DUF6796 family protein [Streptomyces chattanoogensis]
MPTRPTHHAQQQLTHINSRDDQVTWTHAVRLAGICGILASIAWLLGDILLLGKPMASSDRYPILGAYDGVTGDSLAAMLPASTTRLAWGALLGVLTGPFYLAACWHLYRGLRPARRLLSLPPFLLLATGFVLAPFVHGSFFYWGQAAKAVHGSGSGSGSPVLTAPRRLRHRPLHPLRPPPGLLAHRFLVDDGRHPARRHLFPPLDVRRHSPRLYPHRPAPRQGHPRPGRRPPPGFPTQPRQPPVLHLDHHHPVERPPPRGRIGIGAA